MCVCVFFVSKGNFLDFYCMLCVAICLIVVFRGAVWHCDVLVECNICAVCSSVYFSGRLCTLVSI